MCLHPQPHTPAVTQLSVVLTGDAGGGSFTEPEAQTQLSRCASKHTGHQVSESALYTRLDIILIILCLQCLLFHRFLFFLFCVYICVSCRPAVRGSREVHRGQSLQQEEGGDIHHHRRAVQLRCRVSSCEAIKKRKKRFCSLISDFRKSTMHHDFKPAFLNWWVRTLKWVMELF